MAANTNGVAAGSHENHDFLNKKSGISDVNIMFESEPRVTERGSPSLVGRGIANPMSERTRGFEIPEGDGYPTPRAILVFSSDAAPISRPTRLGDPPAAAVTSNLLK